MKLSWQTQFGALVVVAMLLWLAAFGISYQSFNIELRPVVTNLAAGLALSDNPEPITAMIRARVGAAYRLKSNGVVTAEFDLSAAVSEGSYQIKPNISVNLKDAWLVNAQPESIKVKLVPAVTRSVSLIAEPIGFPATGFSLGDITITPATVDITGPAGVVDVVSEAKVPVNVKRRNSSFTVFGRPQLADVDGNPLTNVSFSPNQVGVAVNIKAGDSFKTIGLVPSFTGELSPGYWVSYVEFEPPTLTLRGSAEKLAAIDSLSTTAVKLNNRSADFTDKVSAELPAGVVLVSPNLVNVKVKVAMLSNNRTLALIPSYANITEGLSVTSVTPPTISVVLSGASDQLSGLSRADVSVALDLRGLLSGSNMVNLTKEMFQMPAGVEVVSFTPEAVEVSLTKS
ncbi:MAG: CdaR family protein [Patescibacteria group bacterium]